MNRRSLLVIIFSIYRFSELGKKKGGTDRPGANNVVLDAAAKHFPNFFMDAHESIARKSPDS